tara:strand:- start:224 stop:439 length:216 start_codon:yes stop_codon:yes gene_type:complete
MPLYSYRCSLCGISDDYIVDTKKRDKTFPCEQEGCTGIMTREMDAPSIHLKGGGWAKDGYSKKPSKKEKKN